MKFSRLLLVLALVVMAPVAVQAAAAKNVQFDDAANSYKLPDLISFGAGYFDVDQNTPRKEAVDFRFEYRWGTSLLPLVSDYFTSWNKWFQIHPFAGIQTTSRAQFYGFGGFVFDVLLGRHVVISPNVAVGFYNQGEGKRLGSVVEFRSTIEAGWRFDNEMRLTAYYGHISNAKLTDYNPGANMAGLYFHVPTNVIFGY